MRSTAVICVSFVLALLFHASLLPAADTPAPKPASAYPRVTLSPWYEVDAQWPQRPAECAWGQTPGIAVDSADRVWVFTRANPPLQCYSADGKFLRSFGQGLVGSTERGLGSHGIRIDRAGNLWLADTAAHVVLQVSPEGRVLRTLGTPGKPGCDEQHFNRPTDMTITPDGQLYVTDGYGNARVVQFDAQGKFVRDWGKLGTAPGEFSLPHSIVVDSQGRLYVADRNNVRVQVFDAQGKFLAQWKNILVPWGLWISAKDEIWACGSSPMPWRETDATLGCPPKDQLFMQFDTSGRVVQLWTVPKCADGQEKLGELNWVHGIALDSQGNIYATDITGRRAQKFVRQK